MGGRTHMIDCQVFYMSLQLLALNMFRALGFTIDIIEPARKNGTVKLQYFGVSSMSRCPEGPSSWPLGLPMICT